MAIPTQDIIFPACSRPTSPIGHVPLQVKIKLSPMPINTREKMMTENATLAESIKLKENKQNTPASKVRDSPNTIPFVVHDCQNIFLRLLAKIMWIMIQRLQQAQHKKLNN